jgi:hypothetical protein
MPLVASEIPFSARVPPHDAPFDPSMVEEAEVALELHSERIPFISPSRTLNYCHKSHTNGESI